METFIFPPTCSLDETFFRNDSKRVLDYFGGKFYVLKKFRQKDFEKKSSTSMKNTCNGSKK